MFLVFSCENGKPQNYESLFSSQAQKSIEDRDLYPWQGLTLEMNFPAKGYRFRFKLISLWPHYSWSALTCWRRKGHSGLGQPHSVLSLSRVREKKMAKKKLGIWVLHKFVQMSGTQLGRHIIPGLQCLPLAKLMVLICKGSFGKCLWLMLAHLHNSIWCK